LKTSARKKEVKEKQDKELRFDVDTMSRELFDLRFKSSSEGLADPSRIRTLRREIARMKTLLREREMGLRGAAPKGGAA
jgi:large subunit ribosomal protein L29